jgi:ssDNA-binding Zn-finger/Zn-ribbon topoisomerase 1
MIPSDIKLTCPKCGAGMVLRETKKFTYKNGQPRKFWGCSAWPKCTATHGAHPDGRPFGRPGTEEEKKARMAAHAAFDELWKDGAMSRGAAYAWLAKQLGMTEDECHIGNFGVDACERALAVCVHWKKDREWKPEAPKKKAKAKKPESPTPAPPPSGPTTMTYTTEGGVEIVGEIVQPGGATAFPKVPQQPPEDPTKPW